MPEKLYSIGETAEIMGLSVQTLRNYSNSPLLQPAYINPETGYRYFTFSQFHIIDRIKYLRTLNLSLAEIEQVLSDSDNIDHMLQIMEERENEITKQIADLERSRRDLRWYIDYFRHSEQILKHDSPHIKSCRERELLVTKYSPEESIESNEIRLAKIRTALLSRGYTFHRQYGYILSTESILRKEWKPTGYFIPISEAPDSDRSRPGENMPVSLPGLKKSSQKKSGKGGDETSDAWIMVLPEGNYFCSSFLLYEMDTLDLRELIELTKKHIIAPVAAAYEYEDNLNTYKHCPYELQVQIIE
ncbi:MAG: helix-turn-helix domain-containing protein [Eubacterium sp.]|nr:helix-turn-helix domain-containing protein [Eubacterium sp.]